MWDELWEGAGSADTWTRETRPQSGTAQVADRDLGPSLQS